MEKSFDVYYYITKELMCIGRYLGKHENRIARRAYCDIFRQIKKQYYDEDIINTNIIFYVTDIHTQKKYYYIGWKKKLSAPINVKVGASNICYNYINQVTPIVEPLEHSICAKSPDNTEKKSIDTSSVSHDISAVKQPLEKDALLTDMTVSNNTFILKI